MIGKILLILGILGILLGGLITIIFLIVPTQTRNVSWDEAAIGIIAGAVLLVLSFIPAIIGIILIVMKRKQAANQQPNQMR